MFEQSASFLNAMLIYIYRFIITAITVKHNWDNLRLIERDFRREAILI